MAVMSEKPVDEVELVEEEEEIHKIYKQSFIDEQVMICVDFISYEFEYMCTVMATDNEY